MTEKLIDNQLKDEENGIEYRLNERGIYKPFTDKKELSKEIPLLRLIAESIIIGSSSNL